MFKISDFARLAGVSPKALRLYDSLGLLAPAEVDAQTGYRYYRADQLPRLNRILVLKALGLSLDQIREALANGVGAEQIRGMLRLRQAESEQAIARETRRLRQIRAHLAQIEREGRAPALDVIIRPVPPVAVASISATLGPAQMPWPLVDTLGRYVRRWHPQPMPAVTLVYHACDDDVEEIEVAMPLAAPPKLPPSPIVLNELPAVEQMGCALHQGDYDSICATGQALGRWLEANHYRLAGPTREVWLSPCPQAAAPEEPCLIELQFPLAPLEVD